MNQIVKDIFCNKSKVSFRNRNKYVEDFMSVNKNPHWR